MWGPEPTSHREPLRHIYHWTSSGSNVELGNRAAGPQGLAGQKEGSYRWFRAGQNGDVGVHEKRTEEHYRKAPLLSLKALIVRKSQGKKSIKSCSARVFNENKMLPDLKCLDAAWACSSRRDSVLRTWLAPRENCCLKVKLGPTFLFSKQRKKVNFSKHRFANYRKWPKHFC